MSQLHKEKLGYTPLSLLDNPEIALKVKGLYAILSSRGDDFNFSAERIAEICKESVDAIRAGLISLEEKGYLTRKRYQHPGTGYWDVDYYLHVTPVQTKPGRQKPAPGFPSTGNPVPGKPIGKSNINSIENNNSLNNNKEIDNNNSLSNVGSQASPTVGKNYDVVFHEKLGYNRCLVLAEAIREYAAKYPEKYDNDMYKSFVRYWSEPETKGKKRPKWFLQKTWDLGGRLRNWAERNSKEFVKSPAQQKRDEVNPVVDPKYRMKKV